jgi:hypothetical protein
MSDKKVERNIRSSESERPISPNPAASSSSGKKPALEPEPVTKGQQGGENKTALFEKFREREERYRREHDAADQGAGGNDSARSGEG